jgi:hypothetical protein
MRLRIASVGLTACSVRDAQQDHGAKHVGPQDCAIVSNHRTQIVAGDHRLFTAGRMHQPNRVANQLKLRVILHVRRSVGLTVAAHIWGRCVATSSGQGGQEVRLSDTRVPANRAPVPRAGPPCSAMCIVSPFTWMNRCLMPSIWAETSDIAENRADTPH